MKSALLAALVLAIFIACIVPAMADVSKIIAVQGKLQNKSSSAPIIGNVQINFSIFDNATGGTLLTSVLKTVTASSQGIFSEQLDLSALPFDRDYWLQVIVNGENMTTRQRLTPAPYAAYANVASVAQNVTGVINTINGKVGIGTTSPDQTLHLNSSGVTGIHVQSAPGSDSGILIDRGNSSANVGMTLNTGGLQKWSVGMLRDTDNFAISLTGSSSEFSINRSTGNVGIGTTDITQKLTVNGSVSVSGVVYANNVSTNQLCIAGVCKIAWPITSSIDWSGVANKPWFTSQTAPVGNQPSGVLKISALGCGNDGSGNPVSWCDWDNDGWPQYANAAGNADTLDGKHLALQSKAGYLTISEAQTATGMCYFTRSSTTHVGFLYSSGANVICNSDANSGSGDTVYYWAFV